QGDRWTRLATSLRSSPTSASPNARELVGGRTYLLASLGSRPRRALRAARATGSLANLERVDARPDAAPVDPVLAEREAAYEKFVWDNLKRNYIGHYLHGMLGMTGFRL